MKLSAYGEDLTLQIFRREESTCQNNQVYLKEIINYRELEHNCARPPT